MAYHRIEEGTSFDQESRKKMSEVANGIAFPAMMSNVCEQFQGFFQLKDIGEIERDAYGMPKDRRRVFDSGLQELKQPDVVMLHYLFPEDFSPQIQAESFKYYEKRCKHGYSLSPSVHCVVGLRNGFDKYAYAYLSLTALLDLKNMHMDKNLFEGIHIACAGGTWCATVYGFGGVHFRGNELHIDPKMPDKWSKLSYKITFKGIRYSVTVDKEKFTVRSDGNTYIFNAGKRYALAANTDYVIG